MSETCPICIESWNRSTRLPVDCVGCSFQACRSCYERYLLQESTAKCMNCQKEMTRTDLMAKFTKKFVNSDYKLFREKLLLDQERAMLPATQTIVEQMMEREKIRRRIAELRIEIEERYRQIRRLEEDLDVRNIVAERRAFVRKCPNTECRGFLSTQWKCNLCTLRTCKDCNECIRTGPEEPHTCDPNQLETARLIAQDSKPCPNCGELIFKIDGCDQIFCTQCHTAFNWRTGRRETGNIHNPHYFEWLRQNNQELPQQNVQVLCGREIDNFFVRRISRYQMAPGWMIEMCRNLIHLREVILPRYTTNAFADNQDLRIAFLRKELTEQDFQVTLQRREKTRLKKQDYFRLFSMLIQCVTDIFYRFIADVEPLFPHLNPNVNPNAPRDLGYRNADGERPWLPRMTRSVITDIVHQQRAPYDDQYYNEVLNLIAYVNNCLLKIASVYGSRRYAFTDLLVIEA